MFFFALWDSRAPPPGWKEYTHPLGALYFYHEEYVSSVSLKSLPPSQRSLTHPSPSPSSQRILTEAHLYDNAAYQATTSFIHSIRSFLLLHHDQLNLSSSDDVELVLDITLNEDAYVCGYYFVSHTRRVVFWLDEFETKFMCPERVPVLSFSHLSESSSFFYAVKRRRGEGGRDVDVDGL